jgi:hypothetical protein
MSSPRTHRLPLLPMAAAATLLALPMLALAQPATTRPAATPPPSVGAPVMPPSALPRADQLSATTPGAPATPAIPATAGTPATPATLGTNGPVTASRPRMSQIIGAHVYNDRNERIGEVDDILFVPPAGVSPVPGVTGGAVAVIQVGGFLGMGGHMVSLPLADLRWNAENSHIVMPGATKESLAARPVFNYAAPRQG